MVQPKSSLEIVEEWREKCLKFFIQSDDVLASTMWKLLDVSSFILKGFDHSRVQRALSLLEYDRSLNILSEKPNEPSIRTMMYGVLQSIHGTLLDMCTSKDSVPSEEIAEQIAKSLEIVEEWKKKCYEFFTQSDDALASTMLRLLEASAMILKGTDHSRVQRALAGLESERNINLLFENIDEPSVRTMMYGVLQSIHGTLLDITSKDSIRSKEIQADEIPVSSPSIPAAKPREETGEDSQTKADNSQVLAEDLRAFKEEEIVEKETEAGEVEKDGLLLLDGNSMDNIYFKCECGFEFFSIHCERRAKHFKKFTCRKFTLHNLDKK